MRNLKNDVIKKSLSFSLPPPTFILLHHSAMKMIKYSWFNKFFSLFCHSFAFVSQNHCWGFHVEIFRCVGGEVRTESFAFHQNKAVLNPCGASFAPSSIDTVLMKIPRNEINLFIYLCGVKCCCFSLGEWKEFFKSFFLADEISIESVTARALEV